MVTGGFIATAAPASGKSQPGVSQKGAVQRFIEEIGTANLAISAAIAVLIFLFINVLFYSSFFQNSAGCLRLAQHVRRLVKTGQTAHVHPLLTYVRWLMRQEGPVCCFSALSVRLSSC